MSVDGPLPPPQLTAQTIAPGEARLTDLLFLWGFALLWCGILAGAGLLLRGNPGVTLFPAGLVFSPFILAGLFLLWGSVVSTKQAFAARRMRVHLATVPVLVGGSLRGEIRSPRAWRGSHAAVSLKCHRRYYRRDDSEERLWDDIHEVDDAMPSGERRSWPFRFEIPFEAQATAGSEPRIEWSLALLVDRKHVASFEVPVFRTNASSPEMTADWIRAHRVVRQPADGRVVLRREHDRLEIDCGGARSWLPLQLLVPIAAVILVALIAPEVEALAVGIPIGPEYVVRGLYLVAAIGGTVLAWLVPAVLRLPYASHVVASAEGATITSASALRGVRFIATASIGSITAQPFDKWSTVGIYRADGMQHFGTAISVIDGQEAEWLATELRGVLRMPAL